MALNDPEIADPPPASLLPAMLSQQPTHDPLFLDASKPNGSSHRLSLRVRPPLPQTSLDHADLQVITSDSASSSAPSIPSLHSPGASNMHLRSFFTRRKADAVASATDLLSVRSQSNAAVPEVDMLSSTTAGTQHDLAFPLVQAWSQAIKQSTLEVGAMSHSTRVLTRSKSRKVLAGTPKPSRSVAGERVREGAAKLTAKLGSQSCRKVVILTAAGHLLQYAEAGDSDRNPEKVLQLTTESVAFASDSLPGRHYVIRVAQSADQVHLNASRPLLRFTRSTPATKQDISEMLLIMPDPLEMEAWLSAVRQVIKSLRTSSLSRASTVHESDQRGQREGSTLAKTPSQSHRYQIKRDPTRVAVLLSSSTSVHSQNTSTTRPSPSLASVSTPALPLDQHKLIRASVAAASSDGAGTRHMSMTSSREGTLTQMRVESDSTKHPCLRMETRMDRREKHDSKIFSLPEGREAIHLGTEKISGGATSSFPHIDNREDQTRRIRSPVLLPSSVTGIDLRSQRRQSQPPPLPLPSRNGSIPTTSRSTRNSVMSPPSVTARDFVKAEHILPTQQPQRSKTTSSQPQVSLFPQPGERAATMSSATVASLVQTGALSKSKRPSSVQVRANGGPILLSIRHPAQASCSSLIDAQPTRTLRTSRSLTTLPLAESRTSLEQEHRPSSRLAAVQESESVEAAGPIIPKRRLPRVQSQIHQGRTIKPRASLPALDFGIPLIGLGPPSPPPNMPLPPPPPKTPSTPLKMHLPLKEGERLTLPMPPAPPPTTPLPPVPLPTPEAVLAGDI